MSIKRCRDCRHFDRHGTPQQKRSDGICRVRSVAGEDWPRRREDEWCGELEEPVDLPQYGRICRQGDIVEAFDGRREG